LCLVISTVLVSNSHLKSVKKAKDDPKPAAATATPAAASPAAATPAATPAATAPVATTEKKS